MSYDGSGDCHQRLPIFFCIFALLIDRFIINNKMDKDYYKILGLTEEDKKLPKDEFAKKIKNIYRKLAVAEHPDRHTNDSDAEKKKHEEKFKEISEAYNVLSDEKKRQEYDMAQNGFGNFNFDGWNSGFDPFEMFRNGFIKNPFDIFGDMHGGNAPTVIVGSDIKLNVNVTLEDVLNGGKKTVSFKRKIACTSCKRKKCPHCNGTGFVRNTFRNGNQVISNQSPCPQCRGTGVIVDGHCSTCNDTGFVIQTVTETIDIPRGIDTNMMMTLQGKGNEPISVGGERGRNGDLIIIFKVLPHANFERVGNDIVTNLGLQLDQAWDGCTVDVVTLNGNKVKIKIPKLTPYGKQFKLAGKGLPNVNNPYAVGSLFVRIFYKMPIKELTDKQMDLLEEFYELENEKINNN